MKTKTYLAQSVYSVLGPRRVSLARVSCKLLAQGYIELMLPEALHFIRRDAVRDHTAQVCASVSFHNKPATVV